jgi:hypothetical protein
VDIISGLLKPSGKSIRCEKCGYTAFEPIPDICPNCKTPFPKEKEVSASFFDDKNKKQASEFKVESQKPSDSVAGIKVKKKAVSEKVDLDSKIIYIKGSDEYIKMIGIITLDRVPLFSFNPDYSYFLELGSNLQEIASSILHGELDRMTFQAVSEDFIPGEKIDQKNLNIREKMTFAKDDNCLYMVFGVFPDKKAYWILNQFKMHIKELSRQRDLNNIQDIDLYSIQLELKKKIAVSIQELIKLQTTFTDSPIQSTTDFMRVDYVGLSYQSVGVFSKLITDKIVIEDIVVQHTEQDSAESRELKESLISAKLEAIAANTVANTKLMPYYISVKVGFDTYRFIIFAEINDYYIQVLSEGNPVRISDLSEWLKQLAKPYTAEPFKGNVGKFKDLLKDIINLLN